MPRSRLDMYDQHLCILVFIPLFCPLVGFVEQNRDCIGFLDYLFFTTYSQRDLIRKKKLYVLVFVFMNGYKLLYICIAFPSLLPQYCVFKIL